MSKAPSDIPQAGPARHEPSGARRPDCTGYGGAREPDPTDEFIGMLKELGHLGMRLARRVVVEAEAVDADAQAPAVAATAPEAPAAAVASEAADAAAARLLAERRAVWHAAVLAHQRLTRSIRLCMSLAVKFHTDRLEREKQIETTRNAARQESRKRLKGQLGNLVGKTIERQFAAEKERLLAAEDEYYEEAIETEKEESLREALSERLDEEDIELDLGEIAQSELYGRICADLGVQPDWARWSKLFQVMDEVHRAVRAAPFSRPPGVGPEIAADFEGAARTPDPPSG